MGRTSPTHLLVGQITRPHGIKGEVVVKSMTDHPEGIFSPGVVLYPAGEDASAPDTSALPMRVDRARPYRTGFVVKFAEVRDREGAEELRQLELLAAVDDLAPLEEGEVFFHDLVGLSVETTDGRGELRVPENATVTADPRRRILMTVTPGSGATAAGDDRRPD